MKKSELSALRTSIKMLAAQGSDIHRRIGESRDRARYDLWNEKRGVGVNARDALLAYAFLRGVPYRVVEPTASQAVRAYGQPAVVAGSVAGAIPANQRTPEDGQQIAAWLLVPEIDERRAWREARMAAGLERANDRRAVMRVERLAAAG